MNNESRERLNYFLFAGLILIALFALLAWFFSHYELIEKEIRHGLSKEARRNPFLAAELFLRESGVDVESVSGRDRLHNLPSSNDILLVNNLGPDLSPKRYETLLNWIESGGHLITTAHKLFDDETGKSGDQLLDDLGIQLVSTCGCKLDEIPDNLFDEENNNEEYTIRETEKFITKIPFESGNTVGVIFDSNYELIDSEELASVRISGERGIHLLQVPMGEGLVTVMSDNRFLKNPLTVNLFGTNLPALPNSTSISEADHAYYLWLLVNGERKVWFLYSLQTEGLSTLLWHNAWEFCLSLIILMLLWLWWQRNRFGPYKASLQQPRRNLLEHIHMAANYTWRQDKGQKLFQSNRERLLAWIVHKHPQLNQLTAEEQSQRLSELCQISAIKIHQALFGDWKSEREFIQLTYTLQNMRKRL